MQDTQIERYPKAKERPEAKRFPMPKGSPVPSVTIREIFGVDELEAAAMVDAMHAIEDASDIIRGEKREAVRRSIMALGNVDVPPDVPIFAIDKWGRAPMKALERFFGVVNGLKRTESDEAIAAGEERWDDKAGRRGVRYKFPERCSLEAVTIWEIGGNEEIRAALRCDAMDDAGAAVTALRHRRELIRESLGDDGKGLDFDAVNIRTSMMLSLLFDAVNSIPEEEISGCVAAAVDVSGAATAETHQPPATEGAAATG